MLKKSYKSYKIDLESKKFKNQIKKYETYEMTQREIAKYWDVTNSIISHIFKNEMNDQPNIKRKEYIEKISSEIKMMIEEGYLAEDILRRYDLFGKDIKKLKRFIKSYVETDAVLKTKRLAEQEQLDKDVIADFLENMLTNDIMKKYKLTRGEFLAVLVRVTGFKSISDAREWLENEDNSSQSKK